MDSIKNIHKILILMLGVMSFSYSITVSTNYTFEPGFFKQADENCYEYNKKIPLSDKMCDHREFLNYAAGDSIHYFMIAMGKDDLSHTPYTYRMLVPKSIGFISKVSLASDINKIDYNDLLFKRISQVVRLLNFISCFLLLFIPFYHFKDYFYKKNTSSIFYTIALMNLVNIGVLMTVPFFMLDIPTYVLFTLAASLFFRKKTLSLFILICVGIFLKQIVMVLLIPLWYLIIKNNKISLILRLFLGFFPIFFFLTTRYLISGEFADQGQLEYDVIKNPLDFHYLKVHLFIEQGGIFNFLARVFSSIGFISIITIYLYGVLKENTEIFIVVILTSLAIVILNLLLASGVLRVAQVATPFLVFYCLHVLDLHSETKYKI